MNERSAYIIGRKGHEQYEIFKKVIGQLLGGDPMLGDLTGKWIIFADGYVHGLTAYTSAQEALTFADMMDLRDCVVVLVSTAVHDIKPLEMLAYSQFPDDSDIPNE